MAAELHAANQEYENEKMDTKTVFRNKREEALSFQWFLRGWDKATRWKDQKSEGTDFPLRLNEDNFNFALGIYGVSLFLFMWAVFVLAEAGFMHGFTGLLGFPAYFYSFSSAFWAVSGIYLNRQKKILNWS